MSIKLDFDKLLLEKQAREGRKIGLSEVAEAAGIKRNGLYHYTTGKAGFFDILEALCNYFECEPGDLLVREGKNATNDN